MAKRKREGEGSAKASKKVAIDAHAPQAKVIAAKNKSKSTQQELLLHSTSHPNLDYTAKEETSRGSKPLVNHYVGVYDPKTGTMQVIEAKKMVVRGATNFERRTELGQTFGTRKAKKALADVTLNAIGPVRRDADEPVKPMDAASKAMLTSVGSITSTMASKEQLQAVVDEAKPVPKANLDATDILDVYDPNVIIGRDILNQVPIREWQEKAQHKESIQAPSRFVVSRVAPIAINADATLRLRVLRYLCFVLIFYMSTKPGRERGTRSIPPRDKLREALDPAPEAVVESIRRKFSDAGTMRKFHMDLLMTHCCVFSCIVDNFESDTQALRDDLRLDQKTINGYFHEIGGRVKPVKTEHGTAQIGRLALPLDFPKQRHLAPKKR
ncbi:RNA polymerase I associated factor [Emericellopsis cladophorae]|uniref:RNA polymerase I associated factor n=1 Tax=Emericellopsis cladophorae TaxID=2686198 RepID=A0A9Q0BBS5_9HYPO|nr:RNA polymerase I associated factor [Emericellopsis cladophorae]KAI6778820.1 RNA polymerase I associated factor [Emericellopsis cladophorae]